MIEENNRTANDLEINLEVVAVILIEFERVLFKFPKQNYFRSGMEILKISKSTLSTHPL